ncbi:MAG: CCA-adding protein [Sutterellaceae bacterium]|nr:CCA-adding protein [Sutterellaceae bacterium]MDD7442418.1 CCA-adding protein [Sutterellaceae bacterium]MDY2868879.1 CCA-adding protein [Mesosutterella sp.]
MNARTYLVGGYVRDLLLSKHGIPATPSDKDFVVVGATPEYMAERGFIPVGADFPVFLHPKTHEEYALARTERKTAPGYHGFVFSASPDVTLEDDLRRRDLTINAIAMDEEGNLFDPWGGERDIIRRVFRHVSEAFREDPVRILRLARFSARLPEFSIDPGTWELVCGMVQRGEADALVPERVLKEIARGIMERRPSRMMEVLVDSGAWARIAPDSRCDRDTLDALDRAAEHGSPLPVRFEILMESAGSRAPDLARSLRAGTDAVGLAQTAVRATPLMESSKGPDDMVRVLEAADAFRRPERFEHLLETQEILSGMDTGPWLAASRAARATATREAVKLASTPKEIPLRIREARTRAVEAALRETRNGEKHG